MSSGYVQRDRADGNRGGKNKRDENVIESRPDGVVVREGDGGAGVVKTDNERGIGNKCAGGIILGAGGGWPGQRLMTAGMRGRLETKNIDGVPPGGRKTDNIIIIYTSMRTDEDRARASDALSLKWISNCSALIYFYFFLFVNFK